MEAGVQAPETPEAETLSLENGSSGSSLPDQGYAASDGMVDGEDSGLVSSPCDTHPTSPDRSLFLERSIGARRKRIPGPFQDVSSDSDQECATWGSKNGRSQTNRQAKSGNIKSNTEDKYKWLHQKKIEADHSGSESASKRRNKNNNASTAASTPKSSIVNANLDQNRITLGNGSSGYTKEKKNEDVKEDTQRLFAVKPCESQEHSSLMIKTLKSDLKTKSSSHCLHEDSAVLPQDGQRSLPTEKVDDSSVYSGSNMSPRKVTCNPNSRLGMKTFTVVPPKPSVIQGGTQNASATINAGAIKIDEQGNIMKMFGHPNRVVDTTESEITRSEECPLVGKAKAFWSCTQRQECSLSSSTVVAGKSNGSFENIKTHNPVTTLTTDRQEHLKTQNNTIMNTVDSAPPKETGRKVNNTINSVIANERRAEMVKYLSVPERSKQAQPALPSDIPHFLKPARRTSSQYVASAINKYGMALTKPNIVSLPSQSAPLTQNVAFHTLGHSVQVNPRQSSKISLTDNKFNNVGLHHPGPVRSFSYPEFESESQREIGDDKGVNGGESPKERSCSLGPVSDRIKHFQSSASTQKAISECDHRDGKSNWFRSPSPVHRSEQQSLAKPMTATHQTPAAKPEPSHCMSDSGVNPGPPPVNVFGPVKKFKPVICRSIEKDSSLHSNLMEAIQTGEGKASLRKISSSGARILKEASSDENERSALFAAIRAQNNSGRLRKTKSGASDELERFRSTSEEDQRADVPCFPSPVFATSPFMLAPHPTALLHQSKLTTVDHPDANALMNPVLAREAMMEAIRSGSAAEKLKKVAVPTKTVQVNARLGTMHESSSNLP